MKEGTRTAEIRSICMCVRAGKDGKYVCTGNLPSQEVAPFRDVLDNSPSDIHARSGLWYVYVPERALIAGISSGRPPKRTPKGSNEAQGRVGCFKLAKLKYLMSRIQL